MRSWIVSMHVENGWLHGGKIPKGPTDDHCGRTNVQQREMETGRLPKQVKGRKGRGKRHDGKAKKALSV